ncbi:MAG: hypothetical protein RL441_1333, partial [Actinomycetota bacterium]
MKFRSVVTGSTSSTKVGHELAAELLHEPIDDWRAESREFFRKLTVREFQADGLEVMRRGLQLLAQSVVDDNGTAIDQVAVAGWDAAAHDVVTVEWRGTGSSVPLEDLGTKAAAWVDQHLAEPGFLDAVTQTPSLTGDSGLLVALAAGAECAPTRLWVAAGGSLAPVMRPNPSKWRA